MLALSSLDCAIDAAKDLTNALSQPAPSGPVPPLYVEQANPLRRLADIFSTHEYKTPILATALEMRKGPREEPKTETRAEPPPSSKGGTSTRSTSRGADRSSEGDPTNRDNNRAAPYASIRATTPVEQRPTPLGITYRSASNPVSGRSEGECSASGTTVALIHETATIVPTPT